MAVLSLIFGVPSINSSALKYLNISDHPGALVEHEYFSSKRPQLRSTVLTFSAKALTHLSFLLPGHSSVQGPIKEISERLHVYLYAGIFRKALVLFENFHSSGIRGIMMGEVK